MAANNTVVEWTEPSYGKCSMTELDAQAFQSAIGSAQQVHNIRSDILSKYMSQYPWSGNGMLSKSWEDVVKLQPRPKGHPPSVRNEMQFRVGVADLVNIDFDSAGYAGNVPSATNLALKDPSLYGQATPSLYSMAEGILLGKASSKKTAAISAMPVVAHTSKVVTEQSSDSMSKMEETSKGSYSAVVSTSKGTFSQLYSNVASAIQSTYQSITRWAGQIATIGATLQAAWNAAMAAGTQILQNAQRQLERIITRMGEWVEDSLRAALEGLAMGGLSINLAMPSISPLIGGVGGAGGSQEAVVSQIEGAIRRS